MDLIGVIKIAAVPFLWAIIAIIFVLFWNNGRKANMDIDSILNSNLIRGLTDTGGLVIMPNIDKAIKDLGSVIKTVNKLSGWAAILSAVAAIFSLIISLIQ